MKKIFLIVTIFVLIFCKPLFAQETENSFVPTSLASTRNFELTLTRSSQNPLTKSITYVLKIKSLIDSPETLIKWDSDQSIIFKPKHERFISLKEGESISVKATVIPKASGTHKITANVNSWQPGTNYESSTFENITLSKDLVIQPVSSEYSTSVILVYIAILIFSAVGIFVLIKLVKKGSQKARKWLTPPF